MATRGSGSLKRGDLVEVRSAREILATLDDVGALDAMPFMPEMVASCGKRFHVTARTEKLCDTVNSTLRSVRLADAVLLDDARCDGSAHGGCQAECRNYWKEAWLRAVEPGDPAAAPDDDEANEALLARTQAHTTWVDDEGETRYRCQATELAKATTPLSTYDPRPYVRELTTSNVPVRTWVRIMARAAVMQPMHKFDLLKRPKGEGASSPKLEPLDLQPGEWVRVKSLPEIEATLTFEGRNRGLQFDIEMAEFCGTVHQVRNRVDHIIDEPTGKMLRFGSDCIKLEGAVCKAERSTGRWFCPREIYPYWREGWLQRVPAPAPDHSQL